MGPRGNLTDRRRSESPDGLIATPAVFMLHADIVYVLNAARLPGLSDEREKVKRVGTLCLGSGEAQQTGRRPD